ncbi:EVE domain-containing protein [Actinoplanes sp. NPDC051494]|uniref:EVE domain-containing protein n=1 Tax=Actinoplanes sp. NPDC051494 TaxID=3363907 RepID=UPI0037A97D96
MAHWLLQVNPKKWPLDDFLAAGGHTDAWPIRRHRDAITAGDQVALWTSGGDGGVVAVGVITGVPRRGAADDRFWPGGVDDRWLLPVRFDQTFPGTTIARATLSEDPRFATTLVLRMSGGGNPFPVTPAEWEAVEERVPPHGPVAATVRGAAAVVVAGATAVREAFRTAVTRQS